jgi:hypothetical protein
MEHARHLSYHQKMKISSHGCRRSRRGIKKGIDDSLNKTRAENFPNLEKGKDIQVQMAYRTTSSQDQKGNIPKYIIIKTVCIFNQERVLKAAKEKRKVTYKGQPIKIITDFSTDAKGQNVIESYIQEALKENMST